MQHSKTSETPLRELRAGKDLVGSKVSKTIPLKSEAKPEDKAATLTEVETLLKWVAEGNQDSAEKMLKKAPELAFKPGQVTDLAGRTFKGITAFQYAAWALDHKMWKMTLEHSAKGAKGEQEAASQLQALNEDGVDYTNKQGKETKGSHHVTWQPLIVALTAYVDRRELSNLHRTLSGAFPWNMLMSSPEQERLSDKVEKFVKTLTLNPSGQKDPLYTQDLDELWKKTIAGLRRELPAHIIPEGTMTSKRELPADILLKPISPNGWGGAGGFFGGGKESRLSNGDWLQIPIHRPDAGKKKLKRLLADCLAKRQKLLGKHVEKGAEVVAVASSSQPRPRMKA